jgi:flagellin
MPAVLSTNVASLRASNNLLGAQERLANSVERLSSGLRINRAKDDAAGLGVANSLTKQINGANQGVRNLNDGISMVQTTEAAIAAAMEMGQRVLMLAVQGANGTLGTTERTAIQTEMKELLTAIDAIGGRTKYSGNALLGTNPIASPNASLYSLQISEATTDVLNLSSNAFLNIGGYSGTATANGTTASTTVTITSGTTWASPSASLVGSSVYKWTAGANATTDGTYVLLGTVASVSGSVVTLAAASLAAWTASSDKIIFSGQLTQELSSTNGDFSLFQAVRATNITSATAADATAAFQMVQRAANAYTTSLATQRSLLGAYQNQIDYTVSNVTELSSNLTAARSRVMDTDYAAETADLTKGQILQQAATAMLAQANQMPNVILTLLK